MSVRLVESEYKGAKELIDSIFNIAPGGLGVDEIIRVLRDSTESAERLSSFIITELSNDEEIKSLDVEVYDSDNRVEVLLNDKIIVVVKCYGADNYDVSNESKSVTNKYEVIDLIKKAILSNQ